MPDSNGRYGPTGKWIHDRAHHIMEDDKTPESTAYAVATQQAHAVGKSPKGFRTTEGVATAKQKYDEPKKMRKTAERHVSIQKAASLDGQDLRSPLLGGTKFPTADSIQPAKNMLAQSQRSAEVGPTIKPMAPKGPSLQEVSVRMPSIKGSLPKIASAIENDPLVKFLKKHAEELKDNIGQMELGHDEPAAQADPPDLPQDTATKILKEQDKQLAELFSNYEHQPLVE